MPRYYLTQDRNGTEDEICIHAPDDRIIAIQSFWDDPDSEDASRAKADCKLIVDALNLSRWLMPFRHLRKRIVPVLPPALASDLTEDEVPF